MPKRQLILIVVALGALAFAVLDNLQGQAAATPDTAVVRQQAAALLQQVAAGLKDKELSRVESYTLHNVTGEWQPGVFASRGAVPEDAGTPGPLDAPYTYQGYLALGKNRLAVIDGVEYAEGDELADGSFVIHSITSRKVVLKSLAGESEAILYHVDTPPGDAPQ